MHKRAVGSLLTNLAGTSDSISEGSSERRPYFHMRLLLGNQVNKGRGTIQKCSVTKGSAHDLVLPVRPVPLAQQRIPTPPLPTATRIKVVVPVPVTACLGAHHLSQGGRRAYEHEQGSHKHQHNYNTSQIIAPSSGSALPCSQTAPMLVPVPSMAYEWRNCKVERYLVNPMCEFFSWRGAPRSATARSRACLIGRGRTYGAAQDLA